MKFLKTLPLLSVLFSGIVVASDPTETPPPAGGSPAAPKTPGRLTDRAKRFEAPAPADLTQSVVSVSGEGGRNVRGRGNRAAAWESRATQSLVEPKPQPATVPGKRLDASLLNKIGTVKLGMPGGFGAPLMREDMERIRAEKKAREAAEAAVEAQPGQFDDLTPSVEPTVAPSERDKQFSAMVQQTEEDGEMLHRTKVRARPNHRPPTRKPRAAAAKPAAATPMADVKNLFGDASVPQTPVAESVESNPFNFDDDISAAPPPVPTGDIFSIGIPDADDIFGTPAPSSAVMSRVTHAADLQNPDDFLDDIFGTPAPKPVASAPAPSSAVMSRVTHQPDFFAEDADDIFGTPAPKPVASAPAPSSAVMSRVTPVVALLPAVENLECVPAAASLFEVYQQAAANLQGKSGTEFDRAYNQYVAAYDAYLASLGH